MPNGIDCEYTDMVVCPYCGYQHRDSNEIFDDDSMDSETETDCDRCEKTFIASREVTVTYTSRKKEDGE